jgi:hypothetical protein
MHDCPQCGWACDCDGDDIWNDAAAQECCHVCDDEDHDDDGFPFDEDDDLTDEGGP